MGCGSHAESEQNDQDASDVDDTDGVAVHGNTHDGDSSFDADASQDGLIDKLDELKD